MLCLTIEVPTLAFEEQRLQILSPIPLKMPDLPFDIPLSKTYPGSLSDKKFASRRSSLREGAAASSFRSSPELLYPENDTCASPKEELNFSTPRISERLPPSASSSQHEELRKTIPSTPRSVPRSAKACSDVPVIRFEGPCFHGLPCPPPSPPCKTEKSPLTRRRATVPLIQPSSPVLARRPRSHEATDCCKAMPSREAARNMMSPDEISAPDRTDADGSSAWEERPHRRTLTYPSPSPTAPFSHFDSVSRRLPESPTAVQKSSRLTPASPSNFLRPAVPRARTPPTSPESFLMPAVEREERVSPRTPANGTDLEPPALFLPGASVSLAFDSPTPDRLQPVSASPSDSDLEDFAFWSPRTILRSS